MADEVYGYDSSAENTVHYLNEADPIPTKLRRSPERKSQRTVDTIIPTVPRLNIPTNGHDVSFESKDSRDMEMGASSSPSSSRSEKLQRTLKSISLNEREPFPGVRARIAKQRAKEQRANDVVANSNSNALSDSEGVTPLHLPTKSAHAEEDEVQVNSSPESVIVRPIKRKVATAPDVAKSRTAVRKSASSGEAARSKSAEVKRSSSAVKWVDKTPGKGRAASASAQRVAEKQEVEQIRPDSWRKGMAIVRRELKQRKPATSCEPKGAYNSQPSSARSEKSVKSSHSADSRKSHASASAEQVLRELRDTTRSDVRSPDRSTRPKRRVKVETEVVESLPKHRHYDADSIREFMAKKKREKRQQDLQEKKRRQQEELDRKQKLKLLQEHSRRKTARPATSNITFTTIAAVAPPRAQPSTGVWAPAVDSTSYTVTSAEPAMLAKQKSSAEHSVLSEDSEGEGDTTLTEAELQAETPTKQHSHCSSKSSTPRKRDSPLMARTKAVEEEIEQLVQAAKQRNQSAQQIRAQGTPLKQIDQLGGTDTTSSSTNNRHTPPSAYQNAKSMRIASLAHTTAQLMSKMSMLKADLENSAMSRSNSRVASNYEFGLNGSFSPREHVGYSPGHRSPYRAPVPIDEGSDSSATEDYNTHSSASDTSKSHSTVTTDSDLSDTESELSSLDLRIREALARPSNFTSSFSRTQAKSPGELIKPVAKVSRTLTYEERGDGHSVINTYLRKLQADREALSVGGSKWTATSTCATLTPTCTSVSTIATQIQTSLSTTGIQTETTHTAFTSAGVTQKRTPVGLLSQSPNTCFPSSVTTSAAVTVAADKAGLKFTSSRNHETSADIYGNKPTVTGQSVFSTSSASQSSATYTHASQSETRHPIISQSNAQPSASSQSGSNGQPTLLQPPPYAAKTPAGAQTHRISPAGLGLAFSAGLSLLEGVNQQHVQLSDVERTRFSTLAQQETVALAQILKGSKERQQQEIMSIRQKIKQDELEAERKLAQFKRDAELANQRREQAEKEGEKEALRLSKDATRKVLEAQNESTKAFTEAAKLLADRRDRMAAAETARLENSQSVVDSLRVQNETVTASLTTLVDQQRQQNMELLRLARLDHPPPQNGHAARVKSPRGVKSPRSVRRQRDARRSPRDLAQSPRDSLKSPRESTKSPRGSNSPRARRLRSPKDMLERSDVSTGSSLQTDKTHSTVGYTDDFGSVSSSNSSSVSPRKSPPESRSNSSVNESLVAAPDSMDSSVKTDVDSSIDTLKQERTQTDTNSKDVSPLRPTSKESRSTIKTDSLTSKGRYSLSPEYTSTASTASADSPLHRVVLGAVKEVFKDGSPAELQSDPAFYDRLKSVLYTLKEGAVAPTALSTPSKQSPLSSPHKPPMAAPLSPRLDKRLTVRRPPGQRSAKKSAFSGDSESDESHSLLETASDTDQECQLSALQHQLDEAKRRHAMMKKARQKYEFQKKQDAYKKQIEYYEDDMVRMKKEMDDLAAMHSATGGSLSPHTTPATRPQIKQPRAPSSSGSENGRQRHSSGASDADLTTPQPSVIQKPLVGKTIAQLGSARVPYDRQRSDSSKSVESEIDSRHREKSPDYAEDFDSDFSTKMSKDLSRPAANRLFQEPVVPASKDTPRTDVDEADYTYSNGFENGDRLRSTDSISESIVDSIIESLQSSKKDSVGSLSNGSDLLHLDHSLTAGIEALPTSAVEKMEEPSLLSLLPAGAEQMKTAGRVSPPLPELEQEAGLRSRSHSASSSHTITEALVASFSSDGSRSASPAQSAHKARSRSISDRSRSIGGKSRSRSRSERSRSRSISEKSRTISERSRSRSISERSRSSSISERSRSRSISERSRSRSISERSRSRSISERSRSRSISERSRSRSPGDWSKSTGRRSYSPSRSSSVSDDVPSDIESNAGDNQTGKREVPLLDLDLAEVQVTAPKVLVSCEDKQDNCEGQTSTQQPTKPDQLQEEVQSYASDFSGSRTDNSSDESSHTLDGDRRKAGEDNSDDDESVVVDMVQSALEEMELASQKQGPLLSLKEELEAAVSAIDVSTPREGGGASNRLTEIEAGERLAESTPRLNDSETEAREQKDFEELEKMVTENVSTETSADSSQISFGSDSSDFTNFSSRPHGEKAKADVSSCDLEAGKEERSDEESELEKAISSAAAAVESFANELELTGSQADVGLSVIEETTPRSLLSSSLDDLLDDGHVTPTPAPVSPASSGETTPRAVSPDPRDADLSEKSIMQADENQLNAAAADMIDKSMDIVLDLWRNRREAFRSASHSVPKLSLSSEAPPTSVLTTPTYHQTTPTSPAITPTTPPATPTTSLATPTSPQATPTSPLATPTSPLATPTSPLATPTSPLTTPTSPLATSTSPLVTPTSPLATPTSPLATPTSPLATPTTSPTKSPLPSVIELTSKDATSAAKEQAIVDSDEDKENQSALDKSSSSATSLLGSLPPLLVKSPKTGQPSAVKSPDSHSSSSSEESGSPQRSPTKLSFVEEARHEQWAQLDKDIDSAFGPNDGDWYDDDFGLGGDSKTSSVIPTKEILNRVVVPEPVFVVPHEEGEVKGLADEALDIFWQARRCGESWDDLTPTPDFLDTGDKLELEASSTAAFKEFIFDLIKDMLADIFQNEEDCVPATERRFSRGPLARHYRHRKPPNTLDEVREIIHRHIYPAVTGKLVHPSKTSKVLSVVRNKRRDKVDTILTQELREEEPSWLDYTQDEQAVKDSLVEDVFKVLMEDSVSAVMHAYNRRHNIQPITEL